MAEPARKLEDDPSLSAQERANQRWGIDDLSLNPSEDFAENLPSSAHKRAEAAWGSADVLEGGGDSAEEDEFHYSSDPTVSETAAAEANGMTSGAATNRPTNRESSFLNNGNQQRSSALNNAKSFLKRKTTFIVGGFSAVGLGIIVFFIFFLMSSGFGVKQVGIVLQNYSFYRINRLSSNLTSLVLEGDLRLRTVNGFNAVTPSSLSDKIRGFDIEKVVNNMEQGEIVRYKWNGDDTFSGIQIGDEKITWGSGELSAAERIRIHDQIEGALKKIPELAENSQFIDKEAKALFERVGLKKVRWTDRVLNKLRGAKDGTDALGIDQVDQLDRVRGSPSLDDVGNAGIDAARETADESVESAAEKGVKDPVASIAGEQVDAVDAARPILNKIGTIGEVAEGASTVAIYTLCTINGISNSVPQAVKQNDEASIRLAGSILSASDQISSGNTDSAAVGSARKMLGDNFEDQANYQRSWGNTDWAQYQQLGDIDRPLQDPDKGWVKTFNTISDATNTAWDTATIPTTLVTQVLGALGITDGKISFTDFCSAINTPIGGLVFGLGTAAAEHIIVAALTPESGGAAAAGEEAAKAATTKAVDEAVETATRRGISTIIREALEKRVENYSGKQIGDGVLKATLKKFSTNAAIAGAKGGAVSAATVGMMYLVIKLANNSGGYTYSGTSDDQAVNKGAAGMNNMAQNFARTRYKGVPLSDPQVVTLANQQYADYKKDQHAKSFATRLFNLNDPYSLATRLAIAMPADSTKLKQTALAALNPINSLAARQKQLAGLTTTLLGGSNQAFATEADVDLLTDGIQQWGFTPEELELVRTNDDYSYVGISNWLGSSEGKSAVSYLNDRFSDCYDPENQASDILLNNDLKKLCFTDLPTENATNPSIFKWRLSEAYGVVADGIIDLQEITADSAQSSSGVSAGEITADSSGTPCAVGTKRLGISTELGAGYDAYSDGNKIKILLCAVSSIKGSSEESTPGSRFYVPGAEGQAIVSSIASDAWQKLGEAAQAAGIPLSAGSSWRTMAHQEELCRDDVSKGGPGDCPNGNYNDVAKPGTSNHQAGTAMDIAQIFQSNGTAKSGRTCENPMTDVTRTYIWVAQNARNFGIKNYANEAWHWGTSEKC